MIAGGDLFSMALAVDMRTRLLGTVTIKSTCERHAHVTDTGKWLRLLLGLFAKAPIDEPTQSCSQKREPLITECMTCLVEQRRYIEIKNGVGIRTHPCTNDPYLVTATLLSRGLRAELLEYTQLQERSSDRSVKHPQNN